ncbi:hypothetical protein COY62_03980 [bacterium (Candidatus Howlettbacteria) CG_4_10_14_0_8_um_filter_40_9]|nr:MAG: hypothetical protein COY62_03980 [bacterium (Candidatus Howlettbacteria) CG_4_10_14_0_8_um_filter_40_9]
MFKIPKTILILGVSFIVMALIFSMISYYTVANNRRTLTRNFNNELDLFAKLSTRAVIQNYELYFDSGNFKFNEITTDILGQKDSIIRIDIIDTDGKSVFSSDDGSNLDIHRRETITSETLGVARSTEPTKKYDENGVIKSIIYPYVEDWGAHKYSARYIISPEKLNHNISLFRNEVILSMTLLFTLIFSPLFGVLYYREMALSKDEKAKLKNLNKQKDDFMTLVAHNLRTPISIIKGYTNLAEEQPLKGIGKEYINAIKEGAERLNEATETILSVTSLLSGESIGKEDINLTKITEETLNSFEGKIKEKKINIIFDNKNAVGVKGTLKYIRKAIKNYIDNAIKFSNEKGTVEITLGKTASEVKISVKDNGIGIKEEDIDDIFSSFHRSIENTLDFDYKGLGMGLYLTKTIIESHKGKVWAESEYGKGSTFGFSLPV